MTEVPVTEVHVTDDVIRLANEFAEVEVRLVDTRNGQRLEIRSRRLDKVVRLCPLELESLTWQTPEWFSALLAAPFGPEHTDEEP